MSDPISDMITRLRNAQNAKLINCDLPYSKHKCSILDVLIQEGYILSYVIEEVRNNIKQIIVKLKYSKHGKGAIYHIERASKPSRRIYSGIRDLREFYNGMGIYIISTSKLGVISDRIARASGVCGEIICKVF